MDEQKPKRQRKSPYPPMALAGALSGASLGGLGSFLAGANLKKIGASAGLAGVLGAGAIPATAAIGDKILGTPDDDEGAAYMKRSALGGAILGGGAGVLGGALSGPLEALGKAVPVVGKLGQELPLDNILVRKMRTMGNSPKNILLKSLMGGGVGALAAANFGQDEGQQIDTLRSLGQL
jgi:hypothetical protein